MAAKDLMSAGAVIMMTAGATWLFASWVPSVVVVAVNLAALVGSIAVAMTHSFRELRRM